MGQMGGNRRSPYRAPLFILNRVFESRLFSELRERQGLTYGANAAWEPRYEGKGMFVAEGNTRSEMTVPFIQALHREIERVRREPIPEEELKAAKDKWLNNFVYNYERPDQAMDWLVEQVSMVIL